LADGENNFKYYTSVNLLQGVASVRYTTESYIDIQNHLKLKKILHKKINEDFPGGNICWTFEEDFGNNGSIDDGMPTADKQGIPARGQDRLLHDGTNILIQVYPHADCRTFRSEI
jgi:hypothetical protein